MQTYQTTGNDHPYSGQVRCDCGAFLKLEADDISEAFGLDWHEWLCKKCGEWHART
jgi:hypothetical protein